MGVVKICTYNCNSFRNNIQIIRELLNNHDILLLQELMLLSEDVHLVKNLSGDYDSVVFIKDRVYEGILEGRPNKGVAILWHKKFSNGIKPVLHNDCIIGIIVENADNSILILNIHFPFYDKSNNSISDFVYSLSTVKSIIDDVGIHTHIIMGDFNSDIDNSPFGDILTKFMKKNNLSCVDKLLPRESFTYLSPGHNSTSWIDHVLCSDNIRDKFSDISILYDKSLFDHFPLSCAFDLNLNLKYEKFVYSDSKFVIWNKMTLTDFELYQSDVNYYCENIESKLCGVFNCSVYNCCLTDHRNSLVTLYKSLIESLHKSSMKFTSGHRYKKCVPGWNDYVKSSYAEAKNKFLIWKNSGKPQGEKLESMKESRCIFKANLKKCKSDELNIRNKNLIFSYKNKNTKNFWNHIQKGKGGKSNLPSIIDNEVDEQIVVEKFSKIYKSVLDDEHCQCENGHTLQPVQWHDAFYLFNTEEARNIVSNLKPTLGPDLIHLYHLKHGTDRLLRLVTKLLNSCEMHNFFPSEMLKGLINPIIKDEKKDLSDINNYRPIMASSVFLRILESLILYRLQRYCNVNDRQHGFRTGHSTSSAIYVLKETISSYLNNKSSIYAAFIDLTKAFDKVNHNILFQKLLKLGIPNILLNIIVYIYENQSAFVRFNNKVSKSWKIRNGVRQGGVMSPVLF